MKPAEGTRLVLLRHGRTAWNATGQYQGQTDIDLDDVGRLQARTVASAMAALRPDALWSSPLSRARNTAAEVAAVTQLDVTTDPRLMEIDVGSWSGMASSRMHEVDPDFEAALRQGRDHRRSPEGETATETGARVAAALRDIAAAHHGQTVVVASHGLAIRMGVGALLGWDYEMAWWLGAMGNCHWAEVRWWGEGTTFQPRWRLTGWNNAPY